MSNTTNTRKKYDSSYEVEVQSNCSGLLVYKSASTGFEIIWKNLGDINYMTIGDLKEMVATQRAFFKENWIIINDDEAADIYHFLRVDDCYKKDLRIDRFIKNLSKRKLGDIKKQLDGASESLRMSIADAVMAEYKSGRLDSISLVKELEKLLGFAIVSVEDEAK